MSTKLEAKEQTAALVRLAETLRRQVAGEVSVDAVSRAAYSTDASIYEMEPQLIVFPRTQEDLATVVTWCGEHGLPLLARGGGTSLAGQAVGGGVVLDCSRHLTRVVEVDPTARWVLCEPGVVLDDLNAILSKYGLQFGPDVAPTNRATLGGMIGNNSCGTRSLVYGRTVDHVLELEALGSDGRRVLLGREGLIRLSPAQGRLHEVCRDAVAWAQATEDEIRARYPRLMRRVSGYNLDALLGPDPNLAHLLVGSEGTLGLTAQARLNLVPRPAYRGVVLASFASTHDALEANLELLEARPSAVELLDLRLLEMAQGSHVYNPLLWFVEGPLTPMLLVEVQGDSEAEVGAGLHAMHERLRKDGRALRVVETLDAALQVAAWKVRKAGLPLLMALPGPARPTAFVEDVAVEPHKLPAFVARFEALLDRFRLEAAFYAHASVGCLHIRPMLNLQRPEDVRRMREVAEAVVDLVGEFGGSLSGEHGDGLSRSEFNERLFGPVVYGLFRRLKERADPQGLLNPGKIVGAPPMDTGLRTATHPLSGQQPLHYERHSDFAPTVDACNGSALCRKTDTGTMCPSFMVTRDERLSPRGRANALRAWSQGRLGPQDAPQPELQHILATCVECKACKSECPSAVDVARLKFDFVSAQAEDHGLPWRSRLFSEVAELGAWGTWLGPVAHQVLEHPLTRRVLERVLGLDRRRSFPSFALERFSKILGRWRPQALLDRAPSPSATMMPSPAASSSLGAPVVPPASVSASVSDFEPVSVFAPAALVAPASLRLTSPEPLGTVRKVVYFPDTFTEYYLPAVGLATLAVLEAALDKQVPSLPPMCCGRPMLSQGRRKAANEHARIVLETFTLLASDGYDVVASEPSCVAAIRDDYRALASQELCELPAAHTFLVEEYLLGLHRAGALPPDLFRPMPGRALLHVHCQQKALAAQVPDWPRSQSGGKALAPGAPPRDATQVVLEVLRLIPGLQVTVVDSGCCGGAGGFGYETENYTLAQAMGERRLFPAVRSFCEKGIREKGIPEKAARDEATWVLASGTSCRHQVLDATGVRALAPVQLLARALR